MIKEAYLLSNIGLAIYKQPDGWFTIDVKEPEAQRDIHPFDLNSILLADSEVIELKEALTLATLREALISESKKQKSLTAALQLMDTSINEESTKEFIATYLEEVFSELEVFEFVENRLLSTPISKGFDPISVITIAKKLELAVLKDLYTRLHDWADAITYFDVCWNKVLIQQPKLIASTKIQNAYALLADHGFIRRFAQAIHEKNQNLWDTATFGGYKLLAKNHLISNAVLFIEINKEIERTYTLQLTSTPKIPLDSTPSSRDAIAELIDTFLNEEQQQKKSKRRNKKDQSKRGSKRRKRNIDYTNADDVLGSLDYRVENIIGRVSKGNITGAKKHLLQLIQYQTQTSSAQHICMTLCKISNQLIPYDINFAKQVLIYAKQTNSQDPVVYSQNAEILKAEGNIADAKIEYQNIIQRFPNNIVAKTGFAEILKAEGNIADAKIEYQNIIQQFPNSIVAKNGFAEILKAEGNLADAKIEYQNIIQQFPNDIVAKTGFAEILKAEDNIADAKIEYQNIIQQFPNNIVAKTGFAEILKAEGNIADAKIEYQNIIQQFPNNSFSAHALASIYFQLEEDEKFQQLLPKITHPVTESDYYWEHLIILNHIRQGDWKEAQKRLERGIQYCNFYRSKKLYQRTRRYLLTITLEFGELKQDLEEDYPISPTDHILRTHAFSLIEQKELAKKELKICKKYRQIKLVNETTHLLSERFNINGLPKQGLSIEELDKRIKENELLLIATIS